MSFTPPPSVFRSLRVALALAVLLGFVSGCRSSTPLAPVRRHLLPDPHAAVAAPSSQQGTLVLLPVVVAAAYNREELVVRASGGGTEVRLTQDARWARLPGDLAYDHLLGRLRAAGLPVHVRRAGETRGDWSLSVEVRRLEAEDQGGTWKGTCELWVTLARGRAEAPAGAIAPPSAPLLLDRAFAATAPGGGAAATPFDLAGRALDLAIDELLKELPPALKP